MQILTQGGGFFVAENGVNSNQESNSDKIL